jgi:hypothetical protein
MLLHSHRATSRKIISVLIETMIKTPESALHAGHGVCLDPPSLAPRDNVSLPPVSGPPYFSWHQSLLGNIATPETC